jgi:hypothetical protein
MPGITFKQPLHRSLSWLLWLALLLPMAQSAAIWHGYSHVHVDAREHDERKQAPYAAHCELCLTAADAGGSALLGARLVLATLAARHALPQLAAGSIWQASPALAYLSRAPPPASL